MTSLKNILFEEKLNIYYCEILVKSTVNVNKVFIYNEIRGLKNVVVVEVGPFIVPSTCKLPPVALAVEVPEPSP
jgi:hypothetical protein